MVYILLVGGIVALNGLLAFPIQYMRRISRPTLLAQQLNVESSSLVDQLLLETEVRFTLNSRRVHHALSIFFRALLESLSKYCVYVTLVDPH